MQGLVLLDKPKGMTSFKAAAAVRALSGEKRIGHTGTLDPMATGVLPILLGQATRLSSLLLEAEKRYTARLRLGMTTDTLDITGKVTSTAPVSVSDAEFAAAVSGFIGEISQIPPMYSALKQDGVRLYDLARQGIEVERKRRTVIISQITILGKTCGGEYDLDVLCSKGTYIRTLVDDIGRVLGCGAVLTELRRTMTAGFDISSCVTLETLRAEGMGRYLLPSDYAVQGYAPLTVSIAQALRFKNGGGLAFERLALREPPADGQLFRVYAPDGAFLGMGEARLAQKELGIRCVLGGREICSSVK